MNLKNRTDLRRYYSGGTYGTRRQEIMDSRRLKMRLNAYCGERRKQIVGEF